MGTTPSKTGMANMRMSATTPQRKVLMRTVKDLGYCGSISKSSLMSIGTTHTGRIADHDRCLSSLCLD